MRVIAGELRGRPLRAPKDGRTRPTSDRAREGLFNWLGPISAGTRVLDLFAGTGAMGIEALSRGAASAVFVENRRPALAALEGNLASLKLASRARIVRRDVAQFLRAARANPEGTADRFDLVLADPPYGTGWPERLREAVAAGRWLEDDGCFVVEREAGRRGQPRPGEGETFCDTRPLVLRESREYGQTAFDWYEWRAEPADGGGARAPHEDADSGAQPRDEAVGRGDLDDLQERSREEPNE